MFEDILDIVIVLTIFALLAGCQQTNATAEMYSGSAEQFEYHNVRTEDRKNTSNFETDR